MIMIIHLQVRKLRFKGVKVQNYPLLLSGALESQGLDPGLSAVFHHYK